MLSLSRNLQQSWCDVWRERVCTRSYMDPALHGHRGIFSELQISLILLRPTSFQEGPLARVFGDRQLSLLDISQDGNQILAPSCMSSFDYVLPVQVSMRREEAQSRSIGADSLRDFSSSCYVYCDRRPRRVASLEHPNVFACATLSVTRLDISFARCLRQAGHRMWRGKVVVMWGEHKRNDGGQSVKQVRKYLRADTV